MNLLLPAALRAQIVQQALAAFPGECCGLLEGMRQDDGYRAVALHPARNRASASDRFEIDSGDHIGAAKTARAAGHTLIGCYHSHPNGVARPSQTDFAGAQTEDFVWVIAAADGIIVDVAAFLYRGTGFQDLVLAVGADCVTSSL